MAAFNALRRLLSYVKRAPERYQHGSRRLAATEMLRTVGMPRSILVVCHANLCRSPYAAAAIRRSLDSVTPAVRVESAGFFLADRAPPADALAAAATRGMDLSAHRSRLVDRALLDSADLIVVMDVRQAAGVRARYSTKPRRVLVLGDLDGQPIAAREILDPMGRGRAAFDECYDRIDRCARQLVQSLTGSG